MTTPPPPSHGPWKQQHMRGILGRFDFSASESQLFSFQTLDSKSSLVGFMGRHCCTTTHLLTHLFKRMTFDECKLIKRREVRTHIIHSMTFDEWKFVRFGNSYRLV